MIVLCPKIFCTALRSLSLWYSIVPFQCLRVCSVICFSLGLFSLFACRVLSLAKVFLADFFVVGNMYFDVWFSFDSIAKSLLLIGSILPLLFFDGVMLIVLFGFMSVHCSFLLSSVLIPVSLSICRSATKSFFVADAIKMSNSCSVGMNGSLSSFLYFGGFHFLPKYS